MKSFLRKRFQEILGRFGYEIIRVPSIPAGIPDRSFYKPHFSPWLGYGDFQRFLSTLPDVRPGLDTYVVHWLASQAIHLDGAFVECGVYRGDSALMLAAIIESGGRTKTAKELHLFDTFAGMPVTNPAFDFHREGDFANTSVDVVRKRLGNRDFIKLHEGFIPDTFQNLEPMKIAFAHIDVDIYQSVLDCAAFIYPRMVPGGFILFDDYGLRSCPGARRAVDSYFQTQLERPLALPTGQAVVMKL